MGIHAPGGTLPEVRAREILAGELRKLATRHVAAWGEQEGRILEYHGWLTREVPFSWAALTVREKRGDAAARTVFSAAVTRTGRGAKSEVDQSRAR
jgi:hypothetical protein